VAANIIVKKEQLWFKLFDIEGLKDIGEFIPNTSISFGIIKVDA